MSESFVVVIEDLEVSEDVAEEMDLVSAEAAMSCEPD